MAQVLDNRLKPLRKLDDLDVVRELERSAAERRTHTETFIDLVSEETINHRAEAQAEKVASQANAEYEFFVAEVGAASRVIGFVDKNLADAIKAHCTHVTDEYCADSIRLQLARNKYSARKRAFEAQPVMKRVFSKSPRARANEIFSDKASAPPRRKGRSAATKKAAAAAARERRTHSWCRWFVPLFLLCCLIAGFGGAVAVTGRERVSEKLVGFSAEGKRKMGTFRARVGEFEGSGFGCYGNAMCVLCADVVEDCGRWIGEFEYGGFVSKMTSASTGLQGSGANVRPKMGTGLETGTVDMDVSEDGRGDEEKEEAVLGGSCERGAVLSGIDEASAGEEV